MDVYPTQEQPDQRPKGLTGLSLMGRRMAPADWNASVSELQNTLTRGSVRPLTFMKYEPDKAATYFFITRDGTDGILQLLALVEKPEGIRVRYRTLAPKSPARGGGGN